MASIWFSSSEIGALANGDSVIFKEFQFLCGFFNFIVQFFSNIFLWPQLKTSAVNLTCWC
ncbi:hypothetical protein O59_001204 [Cellvibrio sp. BR]|nr:hypothetical protein O59_001204 [Cellvibrio sp. BR]